MAMHGNSSSFDATHGTSNRFDDVCKLTRRCVADGIGYVDRRSTRFEHSFENRPEKNEIRACCVFRRELYVFAKRARESHRLARLFDRLFACDPEFVVQVDIGGREESVNTRTLRLTDRTPGPEDIFAGCSRERGDGWAADLLRDGLDGFEVTVGRDWKTRFNDVNAQPIKL